MYRLAKRILDITTSIAGLLLFAPLMALVALAIRVCLKEPVIFSQVRIVRDEQAFNVLKFRTMRKATDASGQPLSDGERLMPLGRLLRKTSLDELPQFWNVLRGDMSLVGPRPLLP